GPTGGAQLRQHIASQDLAEPPLQQIALDDAAPVPRHDDTGARPAGRGVVIDVEMSCAAAPAAAQQPDDLRPLLESPRARQPLVHGRPAPRMRTGYFFPIVTTRRLRPLRRRRFSVLRPAFVLMR